MVREHRVLRTRARHHQQRAVRVGDGVGRTRLSPQAVGRRAAPGSHRDAVGADRGVGGEAAVGGREEPSPGPS